METINQLLGTPASGLNTWQMMARAIFIFFVALLFIRIAGVKALGSSNAFNRLTILIMGAILGRGIVASEQPFFPSLIAVLVIMLLHRFLALLTFKSKKMGRIFKGEAIPLIENSIPNLKNLNETYTTQEDLEETLRTSLNSGDMADIENAYLERSGEISITKKNG